MPRILRFMLGAAGGLAALSLLGAGALFIGARRAAAPASLGVRAGRLSPCPATPNCVSTQAAPDDRQHRMEPIAYSGTAAEALGEIRALIAAEPRTELIAVQDDYLHAVFYSAAMGFPDDVEFYVDAPTGLIHFRAAARLGRDDLGVNRARMERLSAALAPALR